MRQNDSNLVIPLHGPSRGLTEAAHDVAAATAQFAVHDDDDYEKGSHLLRELADESKRIKAEMDGVVRPIREGIKRVQALYKPALDSLDAASIAIKRGMVAYRAEVEQRRALAEAAVQKALAEGRHKKAMAQIDAANAAPPAAAGTVVRKTWKVRVTDLAKVPLEFMVVDLIAVRKHAVATGWDNPPAGIEYYQEEGIAVR